MTVALAAETPVFYGKPLVFKEKQHRYFWDGKPIPSVTTILNRLAKPALIQWAADCEVEHMSAVLNSPAGFLLSNIAGELDNARKAHAVKRDTAADVGTQLHEYARASLAGQAPALPNNEVVQRVIGALIDWRCKHDIQPIGLERRIMSQRHWYAGTCDFFGKIDGRLCVLDFKTGSGIYDEFWLQTAGYDIALTEELALPFDLDHWIVRLDKKTGEFDAVRKHASPVHIDAWLSLVAFDRSARRFKEVA